ncbi:hypothetical protein F511_13554 [Dorcoceras hygrometricum]|uniref:Uncharacterized protein n=1 Tax=Dorcoceras hygrometricum TaxID=472368 RepID=A0A2Z7C1I0_9LAMI|nr:hypothetical protein F511_13554 [Dorcoceras hygrometricum]
MRRPSATHAPPPLRRTCSGHRAEEFSSVLNSSVLLVQADEGVLIPVVDLIRRIYRRLQFMSQISLRILVGARRLDASKSPAAEVSADPVASDGPEASAAAGPAEMGP